MVFLIFNACVFLHLPQKDKMKILLLTPMEIEKEKVLKALSEISNPKHEYIIQVTGIGRESMAKAMMNRPDHDLSVLIGFGAVIGQAKDLPAHLQLGKPVEITNASLYGYEGGLFENGKPIIVDSKTSLPTKHSLTSDKFVRTTDLEKETIINMEDFTFMFLKKPDDFIIRIISDFLPHETEIDFFEEVKKIDFLEAVTVLETL